MRNPILALLLVALAGNAMAGWTAIDNTNGKTQYVDKATIHRSGRTMKMWSLTDLAQSESLPNGGSYSSVIALVEYDCAERRTRTLQASAHQGQMRKGEEVHSTSVPGEWHYVEPGRVLEIEMQIACKQK